jgi:hypothetical protein
MHEGAREQNAHLVELKLLIPEDLHRAFQRCSWS